MDNFSENIDEINSKFERVVSQLLFIEIYGNSPHIFLQIHCHGLLILRIQSNSKTTHSNFDFGMSAFSEIPTK